MAVPTHGWWPATGDGHPAPLWANMKEPAMATHHEARRVEMIARDVDELAAHLKREVKRLEEFSAALRKIEDDGTPLDSTEKYNIRNNTRRAAFEPMRNGGLVTSVETMLYSLDRFVDEDD